MKTHVRTYIRVVAPRSQANRFCATSRGVAIETRAVTYLGNSRTADSFSASALCGGAIGKPNFGIPRARIREIEPHGATVQW